MSGPRCLTPKLPPGRLADSRARSRGSSRVAQSQHPGTPAHTPARRTRRCSYQKATCLRPLFSLGQTASSARSDGGSYDIATPQTEVRNLGQLGNLSSGVCEHVCPPSAWRVSPVARTAWAEALFSSRATRSSTGSVVALGRMAYSWQAAVCHTAPPARSATPPSAGATPPPGCRPVIWRSVLLKKLQSSVQSCDGRANNNRGPTVGCRPCVACPRVILLQTAR